MDYEQWKPLGRGDPLKNDPTYDYVPPVLERVHYWIEPALRKPDPHMAGDNQKTEILVLGVSSKKPSGSSSVTDRRDNYDQFLKFVEGPKFSGHQRVSRPHYTLPASYYPSSFYSNKNKLSDRPGFLGKGEQRVPYTMLVPPPVHNKLETADFQKPLEMTSDAPTVSSQAQYTTSSFSDGNTTPRVVIQQSNLVYHSSSISHQEWRDKHNHFATQGESSSHVTWKTPTPKSTNSQSDNQELGVVTAKSDVNFVTLPPITSQEEHQVMHKGQVTDDTMDIASTYVNIGKPEAQLHPPTGVDISSVQIPSPSMAARQPPMIMSMNPRPHMMMTSHMGNAVMPQMPPITLQTMQTMQTMQPPPVSITIMPTYASPINSIQSILQKEVTQATPFVVTNDLQDYTSYTTSEISQTTTTVPSTTSTTTATTLTTDPLFRHYKQPSEPLKGPMYLIIQGHSKVKTYGPSKQMYGIPVQETNEIPTADEYSSVKHLHGYKKEMKDDRQRQARSNDLQTLTHVVQTGLGAIDLQEIGKNRRKDDNVREAELVVKYDVASRKKVTSEKYYKGIVEAGDVARKLVDLETVTEQ